MASTFGSEELTSFFDDLVRCETRLYNSIGERLRAEHDIGTSQFELLRHLRDHPQSRVADIATTFAIGIGAVSKMTDRLERQGWAGRTPNPADRRSSLISLTAAGAVLVAQAERTFAAQLAELISPVVDASRLETVAATFAELRASLERSRIGLPIG
jgi:MarR family multiple antibiotic resistance transcriptional regulator